MFKWKEMRDRYTDFKYQFPTKRLSKKMNFKKKIEPRWKRYCENKQTKKAKPDKLWVKLNNIYLINITSSITNLWGTNFRWFSNTGHYKIEKNDFELNVRSICYFS